VALLQSIGDGRERRGIGRKRKRGVEGRKRRQKGGGINFAPRCETCPRTSKSSRVTTADF